MTAPAGRWRLADAADIPFVYDLVAAVDPRWWRFSRKGLEPSALLATAGFIAAGAIVLDATERPVACAVLADASPTGTGTLDYFALPTDEAQALARHFAPEIVAAAFAGAPVRRLQHERFEGDADVLGDVAPLFETEVVFPEFALVDGRYEARTIAVLTADRFAAWQAAGSDGAR